MLQQLRHLRFLTGLALAASPAVGGIVLPVVHPCPVEQGGGDVGAHHAPPGGESPGHTHESCTCIGSCHAPAVTTMVQTRATVAAVEREAPEPTRPVRQAHPPAAVVPLERHPPPTAPPLG